MRVDWKLTLYIEWWESIKKKTDSFKYSKAEINKENKATKN